MTQFEAKRWDFKEISHQVLQYVPEKTPPFQLQVGTTYVVLQ